VVQAAKEAAIPALYFTNLDLGAPADGCGRRRLARAGDQRRDRQQGALRRRCASSSAESAQGDTAGVWDDEPVPRPEFRARDAAPS
jgi:chlorophyllide a reductase subunit Y